MGLLDVSSTAYCHTAGSEHAPAGLVQTADSRVFHFAGLNTGSVLIRNTDWARALLDDMAAYGQYPTDWGREAAMRAALPSYDIGMYEQNMLVYTIMRDPAMMGKVRILLGFQGSIGSKVRV